MAPASNEEQFKFLISCIRYSNNGKVSSYLQSSLTSATLTAIRSISPRSLRSATSSVKAPRKSLHRHSSFLLLGSSSSPHFQEESQTPLPKLSFYHTQPPADHVPSAKRYERMMKANGIHQSQSGGTTASGIRDTPIPSPRRKTSPSAGTCSKKRKLDQYAETNSNFNTDDDEGLGNVKAESSITVKAEPIKAEPIKEEPMGQEGTPESTAPTGAFQYPSSGGMGFDGAHDSAMFDDFLAFGGSSSHDHGSQAAFHGGFADQGFASMSMTPATGNGDGQGLHESIVITD